MSRVIVKKVRRRLFLPGLVIFALVGLISFGLLVNASIRQLSLTPSVVAEAIGNEPLTYRSISSLVLESQEEIQPGSANLPDLNEKKNLLEKFNKELEGKIAKEKLHFQQVERLVTYLKRQGSPIAKREFADQIIRVSNANGADYRIIVAISGVESGFCAANYKKYNCFGYLNGVQYGSYEQAFNSLIPRIAREYVKKYGTNFKAFAVAYGIHDVEGKSALLNKYYQALL